MSAPSTPSTIQFIQAQSFVLSGSGSSIGDVTLLLQSMLDIDGNQILTADLGSFAYGTLEPGNGVQEEAILFTGITQNANGTATLTGVSSVSFKQPYTLTSGLTKTHAGASKFILSNDAAFYNNLVLYMNAIAGAGASNASTTVKGIVQAATIAQINAGTATGSTGAVLTVTPDALSGSNYGSVNIPPPGLISPYGGATAPTGWLLCDGSAVSRATYSALFAVVSTVYGVGDNATTFNVPDLRGRIPIGVGTGTGGGASGVGAPTGGSALTGIGRATWKGEETHVLTTGELAAHSHRVLLDSGTSTKDAVARNQSSGTPVYSQSGDSGDYIESTGSNTAHNNIQPVMGVQYLIKT